MKFKEYGNKLDEIISNDKPTDFEMMSLAISRDGKSTHTSIYASVEGLTFMILDFFENYPDVLNSVANEMNKLMKTAKSNKQNDEPTDKNLN